MYTHPFFRRFFSFLLFYLSSYSICIAASTEAIISTKYLLIEHANYNIYGDRLNKEQGRIPGLQLAVSSTSKRLEGIASVDIYSGNVPYDGKATNGDFSSTTSIKLNRFSYRLNEKRPNSYSQFYGVVTFSDWHRNIQPQGDIAGLNRQYQWWSLEGGLRMGLFSSQRTVIRADIGLTRSIFSKVQIDLRDHNLGKPVLLLKDNFGASGKLVLRHMLNKTHGLTLFLNASYWEFGKSDKRSIQNNIETVPVQEPMSQTTIVEFGATYFYKF